MDAIVSVGHVLTAIEKLEFTKQILSICTGATHCGRFIYAGFY
jgi:hypothetical protein